MPPDKEILDLINLGKEIKAHEVRLLMLPSTWKNYKSKVQLTWTSVPFSKANAVQVPDNQPGVYSFLLKPAIAGQAVAVLLYVGKAEKQSLRKRYKQYLREQNKLKRGHIGVMLNFWEGYLDFCFVPLPPGVDIDREENALLQAFQPPFNPDIEGDVAKAKRAFK